MAENEDDWSGFIVASMKRDGREMACYLSSSMMSIPPDDTARHFVLFGQAVFVAGSARQDLRREVAELDAGFRTPGDCTPPVLTGRMEAVAALARRFPLDLCGR